MKNSILLLLGLFIVSSSFSQTEYFVSTAGNDSNNGSSSTPWLTLQFGVSQLSLGDTLSILAGTYPGNIDLSVSGTNGQKITIRNNENDNVIISGADLLADEYLIKIQEVDHIIIEGLKFQDHQKIDAIGIVVINSSDISILNNEFSNIDYSSTALGQTPNDTQNSQPIIVFGRDPAEAITDLRINGNIIHDCEVGYSECLSVNGNVDGFEVFGNEIYNNTNIGIVAIGHEGECPNPAFDQARNGVIKNNIVHDNPSAYDVAAGIYIDGGKAVVVENNTSYNNDIGIEVGCENNGNAPNDPSSSNIIVRNNFIYNNSLTALALGGYDYPVTGKVESTSIHNNTCFNNDTDNSYNGEILITYVENSVIENNIFYTNNIDNVLIVSCEENPTLSFDHNLFYLPSGANNIVIEINGAEYNTFSAYQSATSQDQNSIFADPLFESATIPTPDLHLGNGSPAIDAGDPLFISDVNELDVDGEVRIHNGRVDIGADEYDSVLGLEERTKERIIVFPNPTSGAIFIEDMLDYAFELYALDGRMIRSCAQCTGILDLSDVAKGSYTIVLTDMQSAKQYSVMVIKK